MEQLALAAANPYFAPHCIQDLECLNLSNCHGVRCGSEVLGALACLESVKAKPSLRELNLACVVGVDDFCCIQHLPKLKALRSLELKGCEISDAALVRIPLELCFCCVVRPINND